MVPGQKAIKPLTIGDVTQTVRTLQGAVDRARRALAARAGVPQIDAVALGALYLRGACSPTALADELQLTSGAITALVDRMVARGHAERRPNPSDRRGVVVAITDDGVDFVRWTWDVFEELVSGALARLNSDVGPESVQAFVSVAGMLAGCLDELAVGLPDPPSPR